MLAFCLRYSSWVASARFCSETDFCSFAILMASQNEASILVSSALIAARNTPRRRCSSADHESGSFSDRYSLMSLSFLVRQSWLIKLCTLPLCRGRVVEIRLAHHVQRHPILYDRKRASIQKLNRAQISGGLQVLMTLRATQLEHIVIARACLRSFP
jgi:hypothetical protein